MVLIAVTCTDCLQPFDILVNKNAKDFFRSQFQRWYVAQIVNQNSAGNDDIFELVDMSRPCMKPGLFVFTGCFYSHQRFLAAGILPSIDNGTVQKKTVESGLMA